MKGLGAKLALLLVLLNLALLAAGLGLEHFKQTPRLVPGYNADKINLARSPGERGPARAQREAGGPDGVASEPSPPKGDCLLLANYDQAAHEQVLADLAAADLKIGQYAIQLGKKLGWWVYIPPEASAAKREAVIALLKAAAVKDMAVIGRGSMTNAISLGMFAEAEQAAAHLRALRAKGVERAIYGPRPDVNGARVDLSGLTVAEKARLPARLRDGLTACTG